MTRKRFVKLMMAKGHNRSAIDSIVEQAAKNNLSYADAYLRASRIPRIAISSFDAFTASLLRVKMALKSLGKAMGGVIDD